MDNIYNLKDLERIGHTKQEMGNIGNLSIFCNINTVNIEYLLLKQILHGTKYKVLSENDFITEDIDGNEIVDIEIVINMTMEEYMKITE